MRNLWSLWITLALAAMANAQITKTATFDNYVAGTAFQPSFTDSLSGITFYNSTHPPAGGFVIDGDPLDLFNGNNYLTAGGGPNDGMGSYFGFTASLPQPSNQATVDVYYSDTPSGPGVTLEGFNSIGTLVAQQSALHPGIYTLQITSSQYNITSIEVLAGNGFEAYDNISYTYLPEPAELSGIIGMAILGWRRR